MKLPLLLGCMLVTARAASNHRSNHKTSLEDIEREYSSSEQLGSKASNSPTKYGFVPQRTASSYAATKPKYHYSQTNYQVKKSASKIQPTKYVPQTTIQYSQPETAAYYSQPKQQQQYVQEYQYVQPEAAPQQYQQYENVQYVSDNSISQPEAPQEPQYYFVQQYQSPSTAVESVIDPKDIQQYLTYYTPNSISSDSKYLQPYYTKTEQLPPVTSSVSKYAGVFSGKSPKQYVTQKEVKYVTVPAKVQYQALYQAPQQQQQEVIIKREPKSLLDSYVPSLVQLQYLKQQGKLMEYTKF